MANPEHVAKLYSDAEAWAQWRGSQSDVPHLSGANLTGWDLSRRNLRDADLKHAKLNDADLTGADLQGAALQGVMLIESNLSGTSLREANLQGVDLSAAKRGLQTEQLAGADLTGAKLPEELTKLYDGLQNVNNTSESARKLFLAVLAACLYSWLTIATTTDLNLITNRASSPLPIIRTSIPIVGFYAVAPLLLLCVYFYFHFYLQKLWEELGSLPAIFPDGRPLHARIDPWLLNDLVRAHLPKLKVNRPLLSYFQLWISVLLAWWVVPITMFLFWGRYLPRHERAGTAFHVALLVISLTAAVRLHRLAVATLRGAERKPFRWRGVLTSREGHQTAAFAVAVGVLFGILSWGGMRGAPSNYYWPTPADPGFWVPRVMALVGYSPTADLHGAEISKKKSNWSKGDKNLDSVAGAQLRGVDLQYVSAGGAFLAGADLQDASLSGADLRGADLQGANLIHADLSIADLRGANLNGANLGGADLSGALLIGQNLNGLSLRGANLVGAYLSDATLIGADLGYADCRSADLSGADVTNTNFRKARNLDLETVKAALHWDKVFYDDEMTKALGLPPSPTIPAPTLNPPKIIWGQKAPQQK
jgi:uncharacterized protein YjbI with pentapeptide repeats